MPSPFPGMDPFIERFAWGDFHNTMLSLFRELLAPQVRGHYIVRSEERVYLERLDDETTSRVPDIAISHLSGWGLEHHPSTGTAVAAVEGLLPVHETRRESHLVIRDAASHEVVTIIELLSPTNKRRGGGREEYLAKREEILDGPTHLVEIDLLRGGTRLPMRSEMPQGDYFVIVSRAERRPRSEIYAWDLSDSLPTVPVPLRPDDGDVELDLKVAHDAVYERGFYGDAFEYSKPLDPPPTDDEAAWIGEVLRHRNGRSTASE
jgi:hypothetical protein